MSMLAPGSYVTPASPVVVSQMNRLNDLADDLLFQTDVVAKQILSIDFANVDLDPRFQYTQADLDAILAQLGPLPDVDLADWTEGLDLSAGDENFVFNPALLTRLQERFPELLIPTPPPAPALPEAPVDPGDAPEVPAPDRPTLDYYAPPDVDLDIPVPQYEDASAQVPFPTLRPIVIPPVPVINVDDIKFSAIAPIFEGQVPDIDQFNFVPGTYTPTYQTQIQDAVTRMFNGGTGLPADVEDAMFERARERDVELGEREVDQVTNEWAAKGHRYPAGPLSRRVDRARKDASYKVSQVNREQFVEHWRFQLEQLRTALTTALGAEDLLLRQFIESEQLRFQAAKFQVDTAIGIFNAFVAKYQADAGLFGVTATVYRERINAELAKLEVFNAQIRGQQLIGELNAQDVQIFAERLRALQINAEIYKARIDAYTAQYQALDTKVNLFRAQLEANKNKVDIYEADVRAFGEMIRAQLTREERFNTKATIYSKNIDAWKARYEGELTGFNAQMDKARMQRDAYVADSERMGTWAQAEASRIRALTDKYQAIATEIQARSETERTGYQLYLAVAQASLERYRSAAEMLLKNAEINIQSGLSAQNLLLRGRETVATTYAQLAAGMTSAANISASISDQSGSSISYNFSGEIEVA